MSIDSHLIHQCDIERATTVRNAYNKSKQNWAANVLDVRCRFIEKAQRRTPDILGEQPITTQYLLLVTPGTDVQAGDRAVNIRYEDGSIDAGPYRIDAIRRRRARSLRHLSLEMEKVI
jgi:hypothetical protein